ncbi:hypothetical protein OF83DRAFT_1175800 [Amylostereum chailletii]|nr:hypothetical protein OF83DRAFT_1175800 [Amylostereum chailletii]
MSSTSADLGMNIFGVAAGVFGTLALLHALISRYLPRHLLHHFDCASYETDNMLAWATEGGIASGEIENYRGELLSIQTKLYPLRAQSHGAIGWGRQFVLFCCGLSWKLGTILLDLKGLRANVAVRIPTHLKYLTTP